MDPFKIPDTARCVDCGHKASQHNWEMNKNQTLFFAWPPDADAFTSSRTFLACVGCLSENVALCSLTPNQVKNPYIKMAMESIDRQNIAQKIERKIIVRDHKL